jgi:hypothetical protein
MEVTIKRPQVDPMHFTLSVNQETPLHSRPVKLNSHSLMVHLREWHLCERTISTILNMPPGTAVTFKLGEMEARPGERRKPWFAA